MSADTYWCERVAAARRRGDHLAAFDVALEGIAACPHSQPLHYASTLALARSGATRGARERLGKQRASGVFDDIADRDLACDVATLDGRLFKDAWARSAGDVARTQARLSAEAYNAAFDEFGTHYPAINAATMYLAAGDACAARRAARHALDDVARNPRSYWACASAAEAALILGKRADAEAWLERAATFAPALDDLGSTRRQILFVARMTAADPAIVDRLPAPPVRYWLDVGSRPLPSSDACLAPLGDLPGIVFGALVDVADVRRAARLAASGAEINLVLPCEPPAWLDAREPAEADRVRPALDRVLEQAANVVFVTREGKPDDPAALDLCRRQARGLARLRAGSLAVAPTRLALSRDGEAELGASPCDDPEPFAGDESVIPYDPTQGGREPRAIVFGDVRGFSRLSEREQLRFLERIMGGFADVLATEPAVAYAETAGDGLYVVLADVESAARCCFGLRDVLSPSRIAAAGLPPHLGLRLSAHVGPLYRRVDRVISRVKFCGSEVIRTARIEPVTPIGEIYVTEQFAATLADAAGEDYACDYAGRQPMAKGFGSCRMYSLRESHG